MQQRLAPKQIARLEDVAEQDRPFYVAKDDGFELHPGLHDLHDEHAAIERQQDAEVERLTREGEQKTRLIRQLVLGHDIDRALRRLFPNAEKHQLAKKRGDLLRDHEWPGHDPGGFVLHQEEDGEPRVETSDGRTIEDVARGILCDPINVIRLPPRNANPWAAPIDHAAQLRMINNEPERARELAMKAGLSRDQIWW